jgi:hypothetical protein
MQTHEEEAWPIFPAPALDTTRIALDAQLERDLRAIEGLTPATVRAIVAQAYAVLDALEAHRQRVEQGTQGAVAADVNPFFRL